MNREVAHRGMRKVQLHRVPVVATIERKVYRSFTTGKQQAFVDGIFPDNVDRRVVRQSFCNFHPVLAVIARAVNMWTKIIKTESVDGRISGARIKMPSLNNGNFAPRR